MRNYILYCLVFLLLPLFSKAQFSENFESGTGAFSSSTGFCSSGSDYYTITNDPSISANFTNSTGNFFGAQDIDGCTSAPGVLTWSGIDIAGCSGLSLSVDLAEDDDGSSEDWDNSDFVHIDVSIDGGAFQPVIWVENDGSTFNTAPLIDTDFNGTGDGTEITDAFQTFTNGIAGTGSLLEIRITIALNSGDEDIAIDNISVTGTGCGGGTGPTTETSCNDGIDNDGDGDIDCADSDCSSDPSCSGSGSSCTYELQLDDTYGDGWNGNSIDVTINGSTTNYTVTDPPGYQNIITLSVNDGDQIELEYDNSGTYDYENEIILTDGNGDIVYQDGQMGGTPTTAAQVFTVDCSISGSGGSGCTNGAIGVSGSGCGCLSGCNLTAIGGPNCSPSVGGNCDAGQTFMSHDIVVPDGCTYEVNAEMRTRPGCSASGGDGGDQMKVDVLGGSKPYQSGSSNSTQTDSYVLSGPGTIRVSGTANRADEIITYTISSSGTFCEDCMSTLPIELLEFNAEPQNNTVDVFWTTAIEVNNDYFIVQKSKDGVNFKDFHQIDAIGNTTSNFTYKTVDQNPFFGISYYRLKQVDYNGDYTYSDIRSVEFKGSSNISIYPNPANHSCMINTQGKKIEAITCFNAIGQEINLEMTFYSHSSVSVNTNSFSEGTYILRIKTENAIVTEKLIIAH